MRLLACTCNISRPLLYADPNAHLTSWEFVLNFDYECSIITGKRKFKWAVPVRTTLSLYDTATLHTVGLQIYLACRWSTLLAVIIHLINLDTSNGINCKV
jgi:hypothetical protein